jgi:hypothetical protein
MWWISFGRWSHAAGRFFVRTRYFTAQGQWTPFVKVKPRYVERFKNYV